MLNIGDIHQLQGNHGLSVDYFQKSPVLREALGDKEGVAPALNSRNTTLLREGSS